MKMNATGVLYNTDIGCSRASSRQYINTQDIGKGKGLHIKCHVTQRGSRDNVLVFPDLSAR
jgi:hypothetical protein